MPKITPNAPSGWLVLDKPLEMTSTQAVGKSKWLIGQKKAGHAGTLDPLASGVLPIAFGEATKTVPFIQDGVKIYRFTLKFGEATTTDDREGEIVARSDLRPSDEAIRAALPLFMGEIMQRPPAFSAKKINGERAYDLARAGEVVELAEVPVMIEAFDLIERPDADHASFRVQCGKGTYIRSLARDLARHLGSEGHVSELIREKVGPFTLNHAISLEKLAEIVDKESAFAALLPLEAALDGIPALAVGAGEADRLRHGMALSAMQHIHDLLPGASLYVAMQGKRALALLRPEGPFLQPERVFNLTSQPIPQEQSSYDHYR